MSQILPYLAAVFCLAVLSDESSASMSAQFSLRPDVQFALSAEDPKPNAAFRAFVEIGVPNTDTFPRVSMTFQITLPTVLLNAVTSVQLESAFFPPLSSSFSVLNGELMVSVFDSGTREVHWYSGFTAAFITISFSGVESGQYPMAITGFAATNIQTGAPQALDADFEGCVVPVALPSIQATIPSAEIGHAITSHPKASNVVEPLTWSVVAGVLPRGIKFLPSGHFSGAVSPSAAPGIYNPTIKVLDSEGDIVLKQVTINVVDSQPLLENVIFVDTDHSLTVTQGDVLRLFFSEPILTAANPIFAFAPSVPGDSFGAGATVLQGDSGGNSLVLVLGSAATFQGLGLSSGVTVSTVQGTIHDSTGNLPRLATLPIEDGASDFDLTNLVAGTPIGTLRITGSPFPVDTNLVISGLPNGVSYANGLLSGIPTTPGVGFITMHSMSTGSSLLFWPYAIRTAVLPPFNTPYFDTSQTYHRGSLLSIEINTNDLVTPVSADINGTRLISTPDSSSTSAKFVIPDNAFSGQLTIHQGTDSFAVGQMSVDTINNPNEPAPAIGGFSIWFPVDDASLPVGLVHLYGTAFGTSPSLFVNSVNVVPLVFGNNFILASLPAALANQTITNLNVVTPSGQDSKPAEVPPKKTPGNVPDKGTPKEKT